MTKNNSHSKDDIYTEPRVWLSRDRFMSSLKPRRGSCHYHPLSQLLKMMHGEVLAQFPQLVIAEPKFGPRLGGSKVYSSSPFCVSTTSCHLNARATSLDNPRLHTCFDHLLLTLNTVLAGKRMTGIHLLLPAKGAWAWESENPDTSPHLLQLLMAWSLTVFKPLQPQV